MANIDLDDISVGDLVKILSNLCNFYWVIILGTSGFCLSNGFGSRYLFHFVSWIDIVLQKMYVDTEAF